jgi:sensor domain CHASE-containing protein
LAFLPLLLGLVLAVNVVLLLWLVLYQRSSSSQTAVIKRLADKASGLHENLTRQFSAATADMASRLDTTF